MKQQAAKIQETMWAYSQVGIVTIPIAPPDSTQETKETAGKRPLISSWSKEKAPTKEKIASWAKSFNDTPRGMNMGIILGPTSGLICVDIDPRNNGHVWYEENAYRFFEGVHELSGRNDGGRHIFYRCRFKDEWKKTVIAPGVDLLATGSQVVSWPSIHATTMQPYSFEVESRALLSDALSFVEDDQELYAFLRAKASSSSREPVIYEATALAESDRDKLMQKLEDLPAEQGRHRMIGSWIHDAIGAGMEDHEVEELAESWLAENGRSPDEQPDEVQNWIRDAKSKFKQNIAHIDARLRTMDLLDKSVVRFSPQIIRSNGPQIADEDISKTIDMEMDPSRHARVAKDPVIQLPISCGEFNDFVDRMQEGQTGYTHGQGTFMYAGAQKIATTRLTDGLVMVEDRLDFTEDWVSSLFFNGKKLDKSSHANIAMILDRFPPLKDVVKYDVFSNRPFLVRQPPWEQLVKVPENGIQFEDKHVSALSIYLSKITGGVTFSKSAIMDALDDVQNRNTIHPVQNYIKTLTWDGVPRVDDLCEKYLKCVGDPPDYMKMVSRVWLLSMIARVFKPGCKVDYVPVLSSAQQGLGKSTAILILGGQWAGELSGDLHKTDSILQMHGKWILEFSEMDSIGRSMESTVKAFITRQTDTFRTPYGRMTRDVPRSCIFAGTSNNAKLLTDTTGNRRFLVLTVGSFIDREALIRDRDQLFAEAYVRFLRGEHWYMSDEESRMATLAQGKRLSTDHITDVVLEMARALSAESVTGAFKLVDLLVKVFRVNVAEIKVSDSNRVKRSLTAAGFTESAGVWKLGTLDETMKTMSSLREKALESLEKIEVEEVKTQEPNLF